MSGAQLLSELQGQVSCPAEIGMEKHSLGNTEIVLDIQITSTI